MKKSIGERILNLAGYYWWPPRSNDPNVKGPRLHLIAKEQFEAIMKMRNRIEDGGDAGNETTS